MIYVTGDTHGDRERLRQLGKRLKAGDLLIVCGDFGFVFLDNDEERAFLDEVASFPFTLAFVDGNHENFPAICRYPAVWWKGGRVHKIRENVLHLMRGDVFLLEGKRFFVFGGAYSRDKHLRKEGLSWWKQELPDNSEYRNASQELTASGFRVDYILTHTAPARMIVRMQKSPDPHDRELTGFLDWVLEESEFTHWYCGHWHEDRDLREDFTVLYEEIREIGGTP